MRKDSGKRAFLKKALSIMRLNQAVAVLAVVLACCIAFSMYKFGFPAKIVLGAAVLAILFVAVIWSTTCIILGNFSEEDDE